MYNVAVMPQKKRKLQLKWWLVSVIVLVMFLLSTVSVYAVITGFNFTQVGATSFNEQSVGNPWGSMSLMLVGGYSTNEKSNSIAQLIIPVLAFLAVILYAFRSLAQDYGLEGFIKTAVIFVVGTVMFVMVI